MKERIISCVFCLFIFGNLQIFSQAANEQKISLKQAVDAALNNNLLVRQSDLQMQASSVNLRQAKADRIPDLFANLNHGTNQGRSIDPFTNSYINQTINYGNYSLGSSVTLFNGFQLKNLVRQNALTYEANKMDLQQTKDNIMLNVILAYLQILNNEEQLQQSKNQAEVTRQQVDRLNIMNESGAVPPGQLYDLKGQLGNDELSIVTNQNQLNASKLLLSQLMNVPYQGALQVEKITADTLSLNYGVNPAALYDVSVNQLAIVKAADLRKESAQQSVKVARGFYYPTVALGGSFNTNYSNAAMKEVVGNTNEVLSEDYVNVGGSKFPVMTKRTNVTKERIGYSDQFNNNYNTSLMLSIQVPILNRFRAKNRIALAKIDLKNAEVAAETVKTQLSQNIEQAYFNMTAGIDRYKTLQQQVNDFSESFRTAEVRFNAGAINQVDYLIAKNNVDRSRINLITAKYDYIFRTKILDYYQNKLSLE
jgi:outer membrane protein